MNFGNVLTLAGGLGLFLFGMKQMSESIEKAAGAKLRKILEIFTTNKFAGLGVGMLFTAIVQSSSACTVMVVSFVNSGLINLYQAAGIIMGANIGTTITSQLVSFKLSDYAPIFLLIGAVIVMFVKKPVVNRMGQIIVSFGTLFLGISLMSQAMGGLKESEAVLHLFSSLSNPFIAVLLGFLITGVVQSSSVTVSIVLLLAQQGLLDNFNIVIFIILGCNMGACVSALLASLSGMKDAKRAAMIHFLFNLVGTIIVFIIMLFAGDLIVGGIMRLSGNNYGRFVANSHTIIKVFQVLVLFPFSSLLVKATYLVIPGKDDKVGYNDEFKTQFIGNKVVFNPATAVVEVTNEIERMANLALDNLNRAMNSLVTLDSEEIEKVAEVEKNINFLNKTITDYLVKLTQSNIPIEDLQNIGAYFHVVNDIERIGDHATNIAETAEIRKEKNIEFSKEAFNEMAQMMDAINLNLQYAIEMFASRKMEHIEQVRDTEDKIDNMEKEFQQTHVQRLTKNECTAEAGMLYSDILSGLERVGDHATNIAFSVLGNQK
ncbi:MAG: Na/Pi cotransporter family protein [Lachnospiraceae bacterium]|nr:Na/Pi cotransporter family protein [Lachnospiraceae bacterium]